MELLQLRYFVSVARLLNISRAAQQHRIPQPAMSKTISRLEQELGTPLFDRCKNKLSLTEAGREFYRAAEASLGQLDRAVEEMHDPDGPIRGQLRLLVQQHRNTVIDCIALFKQLHPEVAFQLFYEPGTTNFSGYDLCIASSPPEDGLESGGCLLTEPLRLVVAAGHPAARLERVPFSALEQESFAMISQSSGLWHQTLTQCRQAGFEPRISMVCGDLHCLVKYVGTGMAVTLGPEISWKSLKNDKVVFLPTEPALERSTYVFRSRLARHSRLCDAFLEYLVDYFSRL